MAQTFYYYTKIAPTSYTVTVSIDITTIRKVLEESDSLIHYRSPCDCRGASSETVLGEVAAYDGLPRGMDMSKGAKL
jgi:hypothetical protein